MGHQVKGAPGNSCGIRVVLRSMTRCSRAYGIHLLLTMVRSFATDLQRFCRANFGRAKVADIFVTGHDKLS